MTTLDFPVWLRIEHWLNLLFLSLLVRSGMEILATHPKMYSRDDSRPGTEWARFTRKTMPTDKLYDTLDEQEAWSSIVALPGHKNLGIGRHWHFVSVIGWVLVGASYYILLFSTGQWHRYIPYSWSIFPEAWNDILTYLSFHRPALLPGEPLDAVQKLAYAAVIFLLAPLTILTGAAQSPAIEGRFPRFLRLLGGRQRVRTLHLYTLVAYLVFVVIHLTMIGVWGWSQLNASMIFGNVTHLRLAFWLSFAIIFGVLAVHVLATQWSLHRPREVQRVLGSVIDFGKRGLLRPLKSKQAYPGTWVSTEHRVNGKPPDMDAYKVLAVHNFCDWRLEVGGLVENPMSFSLDDLRALREPQTQRALHNCIQGWSSIGEWGGVPVKDIVELVRPLPQATQLCFLTAQNTSRDDPSAEGDGQFYEVIDRKLVDHPQCLLAYEMNGEPLPIKHGAPLRLRVETLLGFKMAKWVERIEFVADYASIGDGMGGWREDNAQYDKDAQA